MKYLLIIISILFCFGMEAQTADIRSVEQKGQKIYISYDLKGNPGRYNIKLFVKSKNSYSWSSALKSVSGNVGANQTIGSNKQIVWDVLRDRDKFEGDWVFGIEAVNVTEKVRLESEKEKEKKKKYENIRKENKNNILNNKTSSNLFNMDSKLIFGYYNLKLDKFEDRTYFSIKFGGGNFKWPYTYYSIDNSGNHTSSAIDLHVYKNEFADVNIGFSLGKSKSLSSRIFLFYGLGLKWRQYSEYYDTYFVFSSGNSSYYEPIWVRNSDISKLSIVPESGIIIKTKKNSIMFGINYLKGLNIQIGFGSLK